MGNVAYIPIITDNIGLASSILGHDLPIISCFGAHQGRAAI